MQTHITTRRRNRVYKACTSPSHTRSNEHCFTSSASGVGVFTFSIASSPELPSSSVLRIRSLGHEYRPAFLRILAKSERYNVRYDAAKQSVPRVEWSDAATR